MTDSLHTTLEFEVRGYDCGYGGPLRAFALVNFLQEAAGVSATSMGFGMEDLNAKGLTWMLSRLDLRADELPRDGERVLVRTWPAGISKLFALRDIEMRRPDGRSLVRAVYAYLVVDIEARRPLRPAGVLGQVPPSPGDPHPVPGFGFDIPEAAQPVPVFSQRVRGRHIDHNGHANNAHLVNWLVDAASEGEAALSALRVEFLAEALEGDELEATRGYAPESPAASRFGPEAAAATTVSELTRGGAKVARALVGRR